MTTKKQLLILTEDQEQCYECKNIINCNIDNIFILTKKNVEDRYLCNECWYVFKYTYRSYGDWECDDFSEFEYENEEADWKEHKPKCCAAH